MKARTGRTPTDNQIKIINRLVKQAGGERELHRWIKFARLRQPTAPQLGRPIGSSPYAEFDEMALGVAEVLHLAKYVSPRAPKSLNAAIELVASMGLLAHNKERGASRSAMVKRLLAKAHAERIKPFTEAEQQQARKEFASWSASLDEDDPGQLLARVIAGALATGPSG